MLVCYPAVWNWLQLVAVPCIRFPVLDLVSVAVFWIAFRLVAGCFFSFALIRYAKESGKNQMKKTQRKTQRYKQLIFKQLRK